MPARLQRTRRPCPRALRAARIVLLSSLVAALTRAALAASWPTFRGDNQRSGCASSIIADSPSLAWKALLGGSVDGSPIVVGDRVFVGANNGVFAAFGADDGQLLWRVELEGAVCSAAAAAGDRLVVGTSRRFLYCFSLEGKPLWRTHAWDAIVASPAVVGELCIWGSMDGILHATRLSDGSAVWQRELSGGISGAVAVADETVYVSDEGGGVWAVRAGDGEVLWKVESGCLGMAAPVVTADAVVVGLVSPTRLAPPKVPYLLCIDRASGEVRWRVSGARSIFASPLVTSRGVLYISVEGYLSETFLRCQSADGRMEMAKQRLGGVVDSSPVLAGERVYFGAHDGCLYIADPATGRVLNRVLLAEKIFSSPALTDARLYIGASDGYLRCLR